MPTLFHGVHEIFTEWQASETVIATRISGRRFKSSTAASIFRPSALFVNMLPCNASSEVRFELERSVWSMVIADKRMKMRITTEKR
jgi:hypothetical protein